MGVVLEYKVLPRDSELPLPCSAPYTSTDCSNRSPRSVLVTAQNTFLVILIVVLLAWLLVSWFSEDGRLVELHLSVTVAGRRGMNFDMDVHNKGGRAAWNAARLYWSSVNHGVHST